MCSAGDSAALPALGFPIRASAGQRLFSASPRLIAAVHALHRLLVPRHPPCALTILTVIEPNGSVIPNCAVAHTRDHCGYCAVFKGRRRQTPAVSVKGPRASARLHPAGAGLSKLNSMPATPRRAQEKTRRQAQRPARFGRRARPAGRSSDPGWVAGSSGAPLGAP
jgi:hypothetical protein